MTRVFTDAPDLASTWLGEALEAWSGVPGAAWPAKLAVGGPIATAEVEGWGDWDAVVLARRAPGSQVDIVADLHEQGVELPPRMICQAEEGKGFHGQRDRRWETLPGNLHVTARRPIGRPVSRIGHVLTAVPALAVVDVLRGLPGLAEVGIKWVNDIVLGEAKLGGVIVRTHLVEEVFDSAVFGIGLNVTHAPRLPGDGFVRRAVSVREALTEPAAAAGGGAVLRALAGALRDRTEQLRREGTEALVEAYRARSRVVGRRVVVYEELPDGSTGEVLARGRVSGIGEQLELWIEGRDEPLTRGRIASEESFKD